MQMEGTDYLLVVFLLKVIVLFDHLNGEKVTMKNKHPFIGLARSFLF